jgi:hypothetical protein
MAARQYSRAVDEYFWRPAPAVHGSDIAGAAGSIESGTQVVVAAEVAGGRLKNVGFRLFACPHIMSCCNWLAEQLEGEAPEALQQVLVQDLRQKFDIPAEKAGKLLILKDALDACYNSYQQRSTKG